jgi:hypothetical protein
MLTSSVVFVVVERYGIVLKAEIHDLTNKSDDIKTKYNYSKSFKITFK